MELKSILKGVYSGDRDSQSYRGGIEIEKLQKIKDDFDSPNRTVVELKLGIKYFSY